MPYNIINIPVTKDATYGIAHLEEVKLLIIWDICKSHNYQNISFIQGIRQLSSMKKDIRKSGISTTTWLRHGITKYQVNLFFWSTELKRIIFCNLWSKTKYKASDVLEIL